MGNLALNKKIIIGIASIIILLGSFLFLQHKLKSPIVVNAQPPETTVQAEQKAEIPPPVTKEVIVHVSGRVKNAGIVKLPEGSRVNDAVQNAGLLKDSDVDKINLAEILIDGEKIYVPKVGEIVQSSLISQDSQSSNIININTASLGQLDQIPGVGPVTAQKIIDYRNKNGSFKKIDDIMKVSGIGQKTFEKIKNYIRI